MHFPYPHHLPSQLNAAVQLQRSILPWNFACRRLEEIICMWNVTRKDYHEKQTCDGPLKMDRWDLSRGITQLTILKRLQKPLGKSTALKSRYFYQVGYFLAQAIPEQWEVVRQLSAQCCGSERRDCWCKPFIHWSGSLAIKWEVAKSHIQFYTACSP